ncbi:hypothetical protein TNCV_3677111 [Trichonephila clavipes]|nr:hypothetical protein TNCV_3677111 [Trichonephila clavipes]
MGTLSHIVIQLLLATIVREKQSFSYYMIIILKFQQCQQIILIVCLKVKTRQEMMLIAKAKRSCSFRELLEQNMCFSLLPNSLKRANIVGKYRLPGGEPRQVFRSCVWTVAEVNHHSFRKCLKLLGARKEKRRDFQNVQTDCKILQRGDD